MKTPLGHIMAPAAQHTIMGALKQDACCQLAPNQGYQVSLIIDDAPGLPIVLVHWYEFREGVSHETTAYVAQACARQLKAGTMVAAKGSHLIPGRWHGRDVLRLVRLDSLDWPGKGACAALADVQPQVMAIAA